MFTPILGRVSRQYDCASPGAWAQLHPDNKLNTTVTVTTAMRHFMFPDISKVLPRYILGQFPVEERLSKKKQKTSNQALLQGVRSVCSNSHQRSTIKYLMDLPSVHWTIDR